MSWMGVALALAACASPAARIDQQAAKFGFEKEIVYGAGFMHVAYRRGENLTGGPVHVYIEHDGRPWLNETTVSPDPTPTNPLMLRLMALDPASSLYLGRPCYFGLAATRGCSPLVWTHERYSERVVGSMAAALRRVLPSDAELVFVGHSGGGTLAILLAERFPGTRAVVTLAGNLDVEAWAEHHGYTPLQGSLNPALRAPLNPKVIQKHYVGGRDYHVPPLIARRFAEARAGVQVIEHPNFDHRCCWEASWPEILKELDHAFAHRR
jgi:pimeloyl-ACP methyl ester carboxylesterase